MTGSAIPLTGPVAVTPPLWVALVERRGLARRKADTDLRLAGAECEERDLAGKRSKRGSKWRVGRPFGILRQFAIVLHQRRRHAPSRLRRQP